MKQQNLRWRMKSKYLRIEKFLDEMERVVPWQALVEAIKPHYKQTGGRPPHDLLMMLRIHFLQLWHNLSDPAMEEALFDRLSFQAFLGFDCFGGIIPDESSICRFRHLIEENNLSELILKTINSYLSEHNLVFKQGTIIDATLLPAPVSKKNLKRKRDPEMSSTRKNNKWYFGAKGHIGVQSKGRPITHSTNLTTAKTHDINERENCLHGEEKAVFADSAYNRNADKIKARKDGVHYGISDKGTRRRKLSASQKKRNRKHSSIRARVEHPFHVIKNLFGHKKLRYKGLRKNKSQFTTLCALVNIYICRKELILSPI